MPSGARSVPRLSDDQRGELHRLRVEQGVRWPPGSRRGKGWGVGGLSGHVMPQPLRPCVLEGACGPVGPLAGWPVPVGPSACQ